MSNAEDFIMPFGKHKGKSLSTIADEGDILYLDWLRGERRSDKAKAEFDPLDAALVEFLDEREEEVQDAMDNRNRQERD
jgi:hypothetical protein